MLKKCSLFITAFMFAASLSAATKPVEPQSLDDIDASLNNVDQEFQMKTVEVPVPKELKVAVQEPVDLTPQPSSSVPQNVEPVENKEPDLYHFSYIPDDENKPESNYGKHTRAGRPGNFIISFLGEGIFYKDYSSAKPGFEFETGWQFNVFKYVSLVTTLNFALRRGALVGDTLYPLGLKGVVRVRALPWLFPFAEVGVEWIKTPHGGWESPSKVFGGGLALRVGAIDKKAEYSLYKMLRITRTMIILAIDRVATPNDSVLVPSAYIFKGGMSFEF
jgi:hypothetical protein